eukprot:comp19695_c0_seq2/m.23401 comp19695_c0_seq2/g.23401  ORF comp19695_c0_seq2/g.23401 comp19695_c0_seq2/m.23401 type:complete len:349 (-) comp19695_c0_seq2:147-1193(-)
MFSLTRQVLMLEGAEGWASGEFERTIRALGQAATTQPDDLLLAKLLNDRLFWMGRFPEMTRYLEQTYEATHHDPVVSGYLSLGLELTGRVNRAEVVAREGMKNSTRLNAWAHHALTHALVHQGRGEEALEVLEDVAPTWVGRCSYLYTHMYWHIALLLLEQGDTDKALAVADRMLWPKVDWNFSHDLGNATAMLWQLDLHGVNAGYERWETIARRAATRVDDQRLPFIDLHYVVALAKAESFNTDKTPMYRDALDRLLHNMSQPGKQPNIAAVARALAAYGRGQGRVKTVQTFLEAGPPANFSTNLAEWVGGSHLQRQAFENTFATALEFVGKEEDAKLVRAGYKLQQ